MVAAKDWTDSKADATTALEIGLFTQRCMVEVEKVLRAKCNGNYPDGCCICLKYFPV